MLTSATPEDAASVQNKVKQLDDSWNKVFEAARARSDYLEDALTNAEELHRRVKMLFEWLSDGEMELRYEIILIVFVALTAYKSEKCNMSPYL